MTSAITDRIAMPPPERPVAQAKPVENRRAEAPAEREQPTRSVQEDKAAAARQEDKGQNVDRYA